MTKEEIKEEEIILVVDRKILFDNEKSQFQGSEFNREKVDNYLESISLNYESMRRGGVQEKEAKLNECAERNQKYKQPIPYIIIAKGNEFYVTERLEGGGESRLHGKLSMGVGGHMNPIEGLNSFDELLKENTMRELNEELNIKDNNEEINLVMSGLINDDINEVGQVHIGLLGRIDLTEGQNVTIREVEQLKGSWYTLEELLENETYNRLESWGQIVVDHLNKE